MVHVHGIIVVSKAVQIDIDSYLPQRFYVHEQGGELQALIFLKSSAYVEYEKDSTCKMECHGESSCKTLPYSTQEQCQCAPGWDNVENGDLCEERSNTSMSGTLDKIMSETTKLPQLSDVYFDVQDFREDVSLGFSDLQNTLLQMSKSFENALNKVSTTIKLLFEVKEFKDRFRKQLDEMQNEIDYYKEFIKQEQNVKDKRAAKRQKENNEKYAKYLLGYNTIRNWKIALKNMFKKRTNFFGSAETLMTLGMSLHGDKSNTSACLPQYKRKTDSMFRNFMLLQSEVYLMEVWAKVTLEEDVGNLGETFQQTVKEQVW